MQKQPNLKQVAKNILSILTGRENRKLFFVTTLDILINILDILFLGALILIINFYTQPDNAHFRFTFLADLLTKHSYSTIIIFFFLFTLKNLIGFFILRKQFQFVYKVSLRISEKSLTNYLSSDYSNYAHTDSSVHIRKISQQAIQFGQYVLLSLQQVISQSVLILITIVSILILNAKLFLLLLCVIIPPVVLAAWLMKKKLQSLRYQAKQNSEKSIQYLQEALTGFVESNVYDKNLFFLNRFKEFQKKLNLHIADQQTIQGLPSRIIEIFAILGLVVLIILSKEYNRTGISILLIGAFMGAAYKIIPGIVKILNSLGQIKAYNFTVADILTNDYSPLEIQKNNVSKISSIEFENVSFYYNDKRIINDLNFKIHSSDFVGICGVSGKGKTTIINLLLGFLEPKSGSIKINDQKTNNIERHSFLKRISYTKQQPFFIHDTILKNILLDNDIHDREKLEQIIQVTGITKMLKTSRENLDYIIDENGKNISGGERQRITFARALYKLADVIILDEAFTEMDEASEMNMLKLLQSLALQGKIIILITHNKNSFSYCNKIISLNE